jgi:hypothetical protein
MKIMTGIMKSGSVNPELVFGVVVFEYVDAAGFAVNDGVGATGVEAAADLKKLYGPPMSYVSRGLVSFKNI